MRAAPKSSEQQPAHSAKPVSAPEAAAPTGGNAAESSDFHEEGILFSLS